MSSTNDMNQNAYSIGASQLAQDNFKEVASQLESILLDREAQINALMAIYQADGVSEKYRQLEANWRTAAEGLRAVIAGLRRSLERNDDIAAHALSTAAAAVTL